MKLSAVLITAAAAAFPGASAEYVHRHLRHVVPSNDVESEDTSHESSAADEASFVELETNWCYVNNPYMVSTCHSTPQCMWNNNMCMPRDGSAAYRDYCYRTGIAGCNMNPQCMWGNGSCTYRPREYDVAPANDVDPEVLDETSDFGENKWDRDWARESKK